MEKDKHYNITTKKHNKVWYETRWVGNFMWKGKRGVILNNFIFIPVVGFKWFSLEGKVFPARMRNQCGVIWRKCSNKHISSHSMGCQEVSHSLRIVYPFACGWARDSGLNERPRETSVIFIMIPKILVCNLFAVVIMLFRSFLLKGRMIVIPSKTLIPLVADSQASRQTRKANEIVYLWIVKWILRVHY